MGWFSRKPRLRVVSVSFRELTSDRPADPAHAYAYAWSLTTDPTPGQRVIVPGGDGRPAHAVLAEIDVIPPRGLELKSVTRIVEQAEIRAAHDAAAADEEAWLNMARRAAGLRTTGRARARVPKGYPDVAPIDGKATAEAAAQYGRMWWRVYKSAQALGWPKEETSHVESIARRWYAVRDKGGN